MEATVKRRVRQFAKKIQPIYKNAQMGMDRHRHADPSTFMCLAPWHVCYARAPGAPACPLEGPAHQPMSWSQHSSARRIACRPRRRTKIPSVALADAPVPVDEMLLCQRSNQDAALASASHTMLEHVR
jgi:hypothetical protein